MFTTMQHSITNPYAVKAYVLIIILYSLQTECSINIARSVKFMLEFNHVDQQSNNNFWSFVFLVSYV